MFGAVLYDEYRRFTRFLVSIPAIAILAIIVLALVLNRQAAGGRVTGATLADLVLFAMLTGVMSMAIIETVKRLTRVRGLYQAYQVRHWMGSRGQFGALVAATGGQSSIVGIDQLFDLPVEQLIAQISAVADSSVMSRSPEGTLMLTGLARMSTGDLEKLFGQDSTGASLVELNQRVQTGLNLLQVHVGQGWARQVRLTGCWLSGLIGLLVATFGYVPPGLAREYVLSALLVGGFFAWLARDLTSLVERRRR